MAFSVAERVSVRTYLGRSALYRGIDSRLESVIDVAEQTPGYEDAVRACLTELASVDQAISDAKDNLILTKAEDVNFAGEQQVLALCNMGRRQINKICIMLGFTVEFDYYDQTATAGGNSMGGAYSLG